MFIAILRAEVAGRKRWRLAPVADFNRYGLHVLEKAWHHIPLAHGILAGPQAQFALLC
jgi:hypothetical protein